MTSMVLCMNNLSAYIQQIVATIRVSTPGTTERMIAGIPMTAFGFYHQFRVHTGRTLWDSSASCQAFVVQLTLLYAFAEMMLTIANESYPDYEGCNAFRFRCPYTFSGPKFAARGAVFAAIIIFHLTPCMSFLAVVKLMVVMYTISRAFGLAFYRNQLTVSIWSTICMCLQICIFLGFRYAQELHDRKRFLLQLHITRLRSNLQELLDSMMLQNVSQRAQSGETVIDAYHHATVLFCSFPMDSPSQMDPMRSFHLLDEVHQAFDDLLKQGVSNAFKVDFVGNDYMLTRPIFATNRDEHGADAEEAAESMFCISLARLAAQMRADAQRILAGSGLDLRFAVYSGPVVAAVIGQSCRHLRVVGEAVDAARSLCEAAEPWQVLCAGRAAETLRAGGLTVRPGGRGKLSAIGGAITFELECGIGERAAAADPPQLQWRQGSVQRSLKNLTAVHAANGEAGPVFPMHVALADLSEAADRLASSADAALASAAEEDSFLLESGGRLGGGLDGGTALRTACVALCQSVFLMGLPGFDDAGRGVAEWAGRLRLWVAVATLGAAVVPALVAPWLAGQGGQWAAMHTAFVGGCVALAHVRAEPFLILGFTMGANLWFIAPPLASAAAARWIIGSAYAAFLGVFAAASRRDGLSQPTFVVALPAGLLVYFVPRWLRKEGRAARVLWLLDGRRRRERAALWAALRDLLPEYVLEGLGRGAQIDPHVKQAVVLQADVQGVVDRRDPAGGGGDSDGASGGRAARAEEGRAVVASLHELLTLFDREVRRVVGGFWWVWRGLIFKKGLTKQGMSVDRE